MNFFGIFLLLSLLYNGEAKTVHTKDWWKYTTIYEVYIWSFMDSNGDGTGDMKGITSRLDHFVDLGIETIWISPFFKSPMRDMGYDVSNFTDIDPLFGSMADFDELLKETKKRGLKVMVDFAINHSSDEHPWFQKSVDRVKPYTDFYLWQDAKGYDRKGNPLPPNNWISVFGGSAWTWNEKRQQFYYHQFAVKQPDLNLRNPDLKTELKSTLKFWFDKGVVGGRLDATIHFIEDIKFRDEPLTDPTKVPVSWYDLQHIYTTNLWESYEFIHELREYVDTYCNTKDSEKILIAEAYTDVNHTMAYYGTQDFKITHFPFNFYLVNLKSSQSAKHFDAVIKEYLMNIPAHGVANWVSENHDNWRTGDRINPEFRDIMVTIVMTLPGIACIYYGQEIGMMDFKPRLDQIRDPNNNGHGPEDVRDMERLPMQWDDSISAGFSSNVNTWLPVNPNYWEVNVESQKKNPRSRYNMYKALSKLRETSTLKYGNFESYVITSWIYAFSRSLAGAPTYITILNLGTEIELVHLRHNFPHLPAVLEVRASSLNSGYKRGDKVHTHPRFPQAFMMRPMSAVVISTT